MSYKMFAGRRAALMDKMEPNSAALLFSAPEAIRNGDVHYPYRQDSNFYYLTGFIEPEAVCLLLPARASGEFILFTQPKDIEAERWTGPRAGEGGAVDVYQANQAFSVHVFEEKIKSLLSDRTHIYCDRSALYARMREPKYAFLSEIFCKKACVSDIRSLLYPMRLIKSPVEIQAMRKAVEMSVKGHERAMRACRPGVGEWVLESELMAEFIAQGSRFPAYPCIVGGGPNSCVLHYQSNAATLREGELVLVDAGAEYDYYAADITRTYPVGDRFSPQQRHIYELVLEAQSQVIDQMKPGVDWMTLQTLETRLLTQGLMDLGLLQGTLEAQIEQRTYRRFCPHSLGHWLGLDVHDTTDYPVDSDWRVLQPGMVLTVEPGVYIPAHTEGVDRSWWNIGVRIEDDVWITESGCEVLSDSLVKQVEAIEVFKRA